MKKSTLSNKYQKLSKEDNKAYSFTFEKSEDRKEQILKMIESIEKSLQSWLISESLGKKRVVSQIMDFTNTSLNSLLKTMKDKSLLKFSMFLINNSITISMDIDNKNEIQRKFKLEKDE